MGTNFKVEMMGTIHLTDDLNFIKTIPYDMAKIISLDEDKTLDPNGPNVIVGTCLLPPIDACIAEADGDEDLYDIHYLAYLNSPAIYQFISAIVAALFMRKNLIIFAPQMHDTIAIRKLKEFMWSLYGIGVGIPGKEPCQYDPRCIPIWLNMMYQSDIISPQEFLYLYPEGVQINNNIIDKLVFDLKPAGDTPNDAVEEIRAYQSVVIKKPRTKMAIHSVR